MDQEEVPRILGLLDGAIHRSRRSRREIERTLGLGQGYLGSLLKGRIELKVRHVYLLARELGLEPLSFFVQASPPKETGWLQQLGVSTEAPAALPSEPAAEETPLTRAEIEDLVRKTLREELARVGEGRSKLSSPRLWRALRFSRSSRNRLATILKRSTVASLRLTASRSMSRAAIASLAM